MIENFKKSQKPEIHILSCILQIFENSYNSEVSFLCVPDVHLESLPCCVFMNTVQKDSHQIP